MAENAKLGQNEYAAIGVVVIVVLLATGSYWGWGQNEPLAEQAEPATQEAPQQVAIVSETPVIEPTPEPSVAEITLAPPEPETAEVDEPVEEESDTEVVEEVAEPEALELPAPSFDLVQVDPRGAGVIAGSSLPGGLVRLLLDGEEIASTTADRRGKFGLVLDFPASDKPKALSLVTVTNDGTEIASTGSLLISPVAREPEPQPVEEQVADVPEVPVEPTPEPTEEAVADVQDVNPSSDQGDEIEVAAAETETVEVAEEEETPQIVEDVQTQVASLPSGLENPANPQSAPTVSQEAGLTTPEPKSLERPAIVLADEDGVRLVQAPPRPQVPRFNNEAPNVANVVIDTITYDTTGEVALSGRGNVDGFVRIYLDGDPIKTLKITEDGSWEAPLPNVDVGIYQLRVDEVDSEGDVVSRVETPFKREEPELAAASPGLPQALTVQPGNTLWGIAQERFGDGVQYVRVFEANKDLIRDPDLIYPGQVFNIPE